MMRACLHVLLLLSLSALACAGEPVIVHYPRVDGDGGRGDYGIALLRLALRKAGDHYRADLKHYTAGQGYDWPDLLILRHSGVPVQPVTVYNTLPGMLNAGRIDWAPRSVNEIWAEAAHHPELVVDPHVVLRYPTADYFFVNRNNPALAEALRRGLEAALADGSFVQLFYLYYEALIRQAQLDKRVVINLPNPLLTPETPLQRKELWFTLEDLKRIPWALHICYSCAQYCSQETT